MRSDYNMNAFEIMQSYCVRVNSGSGVLVNAMTQDYSYVLTAAHVIKDAANYEVIDYHGNHLQVLDVLRYPKPNDTETASYDCAVLKVVYQERVAQRTMLASGLSDRANLRLVGYPKTERESTDPIKHYHGPLTSVVDELVIFTIEGGPPKATITGMSGGGIYHVQDECPFLIGVEFQMDGTGLEQQFGRVQCYSLIRFKELIQECASAPMSPDYLECFSRIKSDIFAFNVSDENNVRHLKVALDSFTDLLISKGMPPPHEVMVQYSLQLLVDSRHTSELETRELWVAYLEFLVISALMDRSATADVDYIKSIERKRRLLYTSDGTNWISRLEELLKTARTLLDENGSLIVASPHAAALPLPPKIHLEKLIENIAVVPSNPFSIDAAERSLYKSFKLSHLEGLRTSCVVNSEFEYQSMSSGPDQLKLFRDKLYEFIN
ncbi:ABC-three component system protein [Rheinheimera faecalis]